jgi:alcohol dehydrogenase class IV
VRSIAVAAETVRFDLATPTDIRFGAGRAAELPDALAGLGATNVFVVTGRSTARAAELRAGLAERGIESTAFGVDGEPSIETCRAAVDLLLQTGGDAVVGFGGGSALDVAKAVAVLATSRADPLDHLEVIGAGRPITERGLPCVAVPTTAGTGSEVTRNSVLSGSGVKASLRSPLMLPAIAIVDPDLLAGVPANTIAASGMDALAQVIEPLLSRRANPFTDALARDGIRRSARSLRRAYVRGMIAGEVRQDLAVTSLFGGLCLANAGLGAVHGLAAALGARLSAPHGAVCAATLAAAVAVNRRALRQREPASPALVRIDELGCLLTGDTGSGADAAIEWLGKLTSDLQVPGLRTYGLGDAEIVEVVTAAQRASSMRSNPVDLTDGEVAEIVQRSL